MRAKKAVYLLLSMSICLQLPVQAGPKHFANMLLAQSQDSSSNSSGSSGTEPQMNPLQGIMTHQPQYPVPGTSVVSPIGVPATSREDNNNAGRQPGTQPSTYYQPETVVTPKDPSTTENDLKGLFTPQPQYPIPGTTLMTPDPVPVGLGGEGSLGGRQPGTSGAVYQGPSVDKPVSMTNPDGTPKENPLQGLFVQQPQYVTPGTTILAPDPKPHHMGGNSTEAGVQPGSQAVIFQAPHLTEDPWIKEQAALKAAAEKAALAKAKVEAAAKEKAEKEAKEKEEKEGKDGKDKKDKDAKDKDSKDKDKDGKDKADKNKDGKDTDKEKAEKEAKEKEAKEKEARAKAAAPIVPVAPYNPMKEAIFLLKAGQYQPCIDLLTKILSVDPTNLQALYTRAVAAVSIRQYKQAAGDYQAILKAAPDTPISKMAGDGLRKIGF